MMTENFNPQVMYSDDYIARRMGLIPEKPDYSFEKEFRNGMITAAEGCRYSLDDIGSRLNNNVIGVGGSGTGKTRGIVVPAIYEAVGSYVISDPKGNLHAQFGDYLRSKGYTVHVIDFIHPEKSCHYNPLKRGMSTQDIVKAASQIIDSDSFRGKSSDPFWDQSGEIFLSSLIAYMLESDYKPCNFSGILKLIREGTRTDDDSKQSVLSDRMKYHRKRFRNSWACDQFENIDSAPYKTYDCIRVTLAAKFANFVSNELNQMMSANDFDPADIGKKKTAVFVIVSDTDRTMDSLVNMFFSQTMNRLISFADDECENNRLPVPVRFILDDFATNCRIQDFPRMISSIRSRSVSVILLIQAESQLYQGYGSDSSTIISNCDTYIYLGGNDADTAGVIATRCDKPLARILYMPVGDCIVFRRGNTPVYTKIFDSSEEIKEMMVYKNLYAGQNYA